MKFEIHISDVKTFKQCRYLWDFTSPLRLNYEPAYTLPYFFLGDGIHTALDYYYGSGLDPLEVFDEWYSQKFAFLEEAATRAFGSMLPEKREEYQAQYDLGRAMLEHYRSYYPSTKEPFEIVSTETSFEVPIRTPSGRSSPSFFAAGRFDGVVAYDDGTLWLLEHKTYKSLNNLEFLDYDSQATMYVFGAQSVLDAPIEGILYNILRKATPRKPSLLKKGSLSVAMNIDTTAQVYLATIREYGFDPRDYVSILQSLHDRGNTFFKRLRVRRSPQEVEVFASHLYEVSREMTSSQVHIYPSDHWLECSRCPFKEPCAMRMAGQDYKALLRASYRRRGERMKIALRGSDEED